MLTLSLFVFLIRGQKTHWVPLIPLIRSLFFPLPRAARQINHTEGSPFLRTRRLGLESVTDFVSNFEYVLKHNIFFIL